MLSLLRRLKSRVLGPGTASYEDGMDHELGFWRRALAEDVHLRAGLNVHAGQVTCRPVAEAHGLAYVAAEMVLAA